MFFVSSRRGSSKKFEAWGLKDFRTVGGVCFSFFWGGGGDGEGGWGRFSTHYMPWVVPFLFSTDDFH